MSVPEYKYSALVAGDGTLYQTPKFFERGAFVVIDGATYWKSTGMYSVYTDARRKFVKYTDFPNSESMGSTSINGAVNGTSVNGSTVRVGVTTDPDDAAKRCWIYRVNINDPDTAGSGNKRSETSCDFPTMAIRDKDRGHSLFFATRYCDISATTTGQQVISQVHASNTNTGCPPWYGILVGPGNRLFIVLRYDENPVTSNATNQNWIPYDNFFVPNTWDKWYVEYRQSHDGLDGYCRIWRNRVKIVDYVGKLGYVDNGGYSYLKAGIYHFTEGDPSFAFDPAVPTRECWQKGPYMLPVGIITPTEAFDFLDTI